MGGDLASVGSEEENTFIASLSSKGLWLGGTDKDQEGKFVWTDGTAWTYQNWNDKEPNNAGDKEDCLQMDGSGSWNDLSCTDHAFWPTNYVCKKTVRVGQYEASRLSLSITELNENNVFTF